MRTLLFISNWSFQDGLTQATVLPHIRILAEGGAWDKILFASLEFDQTESQELGIGIVHRPFCMREYRSRFWDRFHRWRSYRRFLVQISRESGVTCVIARGAAAGIIADRIARPMGIPYYVESFEPHASYMVNAGIWKKWDPRFLVQWTGERLIKKHARGLMPVSEKYRLKLIQEGLDERSVRTIPCNVDLDRFSWDGEDRNRIRKALSIDENEFVGVYVGKLGGLYYDDEALGLWKSCFRAWANFRLIWLTPQDPVVIRKRLDVAGLPLNKIEIRFVSHNQVPAYLSAADFAFSLHRVTAVSAYFSPIKNGEYWANGLPVVITEGIGDDADIMNETQCNLVLPGNWPQLDLLPILHDRQANLSRFCTPGGTRDLAVSRRNFSITKMVYQYFGIY